MAVVRAKHRTRYSVEDDNRLWVAEGRLPPRRIEGAWQLDRSNRLVYAVESREGELPRRIELDGAWSLSRDHRLTFVLHDAAESRRETLYVRGALVAADAHAVTIALDRREGAGRASAERLTLTGRWQADPKNRLSFLVSRADGAEDRLTLQGAWHVGDGHELVYQYRRPSRPSVSSIHTLKFDGTWAILDARHVAYRLEASGESGFAFRAQIERSHLNASAGRVSYRIGVGASQSRTGRVRIELIGQWKFGQGRSVSFELASPGNRRQALRFQAATRIGAQGSLELELFTERGAATGMTMSVQRRVTEAARWFARVQRQGQATEAMAGVQVKF